MANRFVQKLRRYAALTAGEIAAIERATSQPANYGVRQHLIREGDRPGPVFVMLDGWAFRYKILPNGSRQIMAFLMPGDACDLHVGMLAAMDHSIQTATPAQIAVIPGRVMEDLVGTYPGIARAMYVAQLADEGTLRAWIVSMGRRSSAERVAHLLVELYLREVRFGGADQGKMEVPLSQLLLADALGMTTVHINRVLQNLRRSSAVELQRGKIRIVDTRALVRLSGYDESYLHRQMRNLM